VKYRQQELQIPPSIRKARHGLAPSLVLAVSLLGAWAVGAQSDKPSSRSVKDGVYTEAQAKRGQAVYLEECARCHSDTLAGGENSPALAGDAFLDKWNGKTVNDLFELIRGTMPADSPGRLSRQQYVDIVAFMFEMNKFPPGKVELDRDSAHLKDIVINTKQ
jgi:mono/diheme cytochrome c family protein